MNSPELPATLGCHASEIFYRQQYAPTRFASNCLESMQKSVWTILHATTAYDRPLALSPSLLRLSPAINRHWLGFLIHAGPPPSQHFAQQPKFGPADGSHGHHKNDKTDDPYANCYEQVQQPLVWNERNKCGHH